MRKKIMTRQMAVTVSEDTWNKILKVTDKEEISISSWIREAVERYLCYKDESGEEVIKQSVKTEERRTHKTVSFEFLLLENLPSLPGITCGDSKFIS